MKLNISRMIDEINTLSFEDRLLIIEGIWNSFPKDASAIPISPALQAELDRRIDKYEANPSDVLTWDEVLEQLQDEQ